MELSGRNADTMQAAAMHTSEKGNTQDKIVHFIANILKNTDICTCSSADPTTSMQAGSALRSSIATGFLSAIGPLFAMGRLFVPVSARREGFLISK